MLRHTNCIRTGRRLTYRTVHILSDIELQEYNRVGYVVVRNNLSSEIVQKYNNNFLDIVNKKVKLAPTATVLKDVSMGEKRKQAQMEESTVTKIQNFEDCPTLNSYCLEPNILNNVKRLIGPNLYSIHTMFINKPSDLGTGSSRHPPHQDQLYFPYSPEGRMVAAWTALEEITEANGCLFVYPGTHTMPLLEHGYPKDGLVNIAYHGIHDLPTSLKPVQVEMGPGDTAFFHPLLIHGSGPNLTPRYRKAISCHYAASDVNLVEVSKTLQHDLTKEAEQMFKKNRGFPCDYTTLFRVKSRHVCGEKSNAIELDPQWRKEFFEKLIAAQLLKQQRTD